MTTEGWNDEKNPVSAKPMPCPRNGWRYGWNSLPSWMSCFSFYWNLKKYRRASVDAVYYGLSLVARADKPLNIIVPHYTSWMNFEHRPASHESYTPSYVMIYVIIRHHIQYVIICRHTVNHTHHTPSTITHHHRFIDHQVSSNMIIHLHNSWKIIAKGAWTSFNHLDISQNRGTSKWMVYNGKPYWNGMIWGYPYSWKHPLRWVFSIFPNGFVQRTVASRRIARCTTGMKNILSIVWCLVMRLSPWMVLRRSKTCDLTEKMVDLNCWCFQNRPKGTYPKHELSISNEFVNR